MNISYIALKSVSFEISRLSGNREVLNEYLVEIINMREKLKVELALVPGAKFMV